MKLMRDEAARRCVRREVLPAKARASYLVEAEQPRGSLSTADTLLRCGCSVELSKQVLAAASALQLCSYRDNYDSDQRDACAEFRKQFAVLHIKR